MSYDFRLFKRKTGEDPLVTAHADSDGPPTTTPDPQKEALKHRVATALIVHNPQLEIFQFDYDAIAKTRKVSVEEAHLKYRHLELNSPSAGTNGIQITLYDDEASVTVPYWHDSAKASDTFREIWGYLKIVCRETGYLAYDPQIDRLLDTAAGFDESLACYTGVVHQMRPKPPASQKKKKPWWKFGR